MAAPVRRRVLKRARRAAEAAAEGGRATRWSNQEHQSRRRLNLDGRVSLLPTWDARRSRSQQRHRPMRLTLGDRRAARCLSWPGDWRRKPMPW